MQMHTDRHARRFLAGIQDARIAVDSRFRGNDAGKSAGWNITRSSGDVFRKNPSTKYAFHLWLMT